MREELMTFNRSGLHRSNAGRKMMPRDEGSKKVAEQNSTNSTYDYSRTYHSNGISNAACLDLPAQDYMQLGSFWVEALSGGIYWPSDSNPVPEPAPSQKVNMFFTRTPGKSKYILEEEEVPVRAGPAQPPGPATEFYQDQRFEDLQDIQEELSRESMPKTQKIGNKGSTNGTQKSRQENARVKQQEEHQELEVVSEYEDEHEDDGEEIDTDTLTRYPPPGVLRELPRRQRSTSSKTRAWFPWTDDEDENESEKRAIIRQIVQSSVDNVVDQVKAENARLQQLEEQRRQEEAAQRDKGKGKARADDGNVDTGAATIPAIRISSEDSEPAVASGSSTGRGRFSLGRLFRGAGLGTTSSSEASSSRETLSPQTSIDSRTAEAENSSYSPLLWFAKKHRKAGHGSDGGSSTETSECIACFTDLAPKYLVATPCKHLYCQPCFTNLITTTLDSNSEAQWPPKCCLTAIPHRTIAKYSPPSLLRRYKAKEDEYKIPADQRIYCATPDCGEWISPTRKAIDKAAKTARCSRNHTMCLMCLGAPHKNAETCPQDRDLQLLDEIAEESGWKKCFKCQMLVEHREACAHMTCRCGAQFCYICGARWKTCHCDSTELARIKERAEQKRLEREARDRGGGKGSSSSAAADVAEAEWLADALRQIEEMERQEEERREAERRELEELRRLEAEERARREEARLRELEARFLRLQGELLGVQGWQRTLLFKAQKKEKGVCRDVALRKRDEVREKLDRERLELRSECAARVAAREAEWEKDFSVRVAREHELEAEYALKLVEAENELGGPEHTKAALDSYMMKNDARLDAWRKKTGEELERFRQGVQEELAVSEGMIDALVRRAETTVGDEIQEVRTRHKAEVRWFALATAERNRLLAEMEAVERENGGEMPSVAGSPPNLAGDESDGGSLLL